MSALNGLARVAERLAKARMAERLAPCALAKKPTEKAKLSWVGDSCEFSCS